MENEKASVKLSVYSWHYKLIKWTLGSNAPTPYNMHNLCPYFWLLVFSLLVNVTLLFPIFKLLIRGLDFIGEKLYNSLDNLSRPAAEQWFNNLTDTQAYMLWEDYYWDDEIKPKNRLTGQKLDIPYNFKKIQKMSSSSILYKYLLEKKNINMYQDSEGYNAWRRSVEASLGEKPITHVKYKQKSNVSVVLENMGDSFHRMLDTISGAFDGWKNIIKWTKRVVGATITALGLIGLFFIVEWLGRGLVYMVQHWDWHVFMIFVLVTLGLGFTLLCVWLLNLFTEYLKAKDYDVWYAKLFYYVIILPLKWLLVDFVITTIFVNILYKFLCVTIIWGGLKLIWRGILGFLGIFGEYFGASYGDYCPGIEWEENKPINPSTKPIDPSTNL